MKSILIIENDTMVRRFLRAALEASNYSVKEAESDGKGFEAAARGDIGAIVLDCMGTRAGGLRTLKKLRTDPRTHLIPVIAMSGLGQYGYDLPLWASACLVKPFRPSQLIRKIQGLPAQTLQSLLPEQNPERTLAAAAV
jgi:two-component system, OmpR family, KDP operon response regulator KdpE